MIEVLVLVGSCRSGLAVARSLARHGVSFAVAGPDPGSLAFHSRHVRRAFVCPEEPDAFRRFVLRAVGEHGVRLVMPVTDLTTLALDAFRKDLEPRVKLAMPKSDALHAVIDKRENLALARRLGIPCPRQFEPRGPDDAPAMIEALGLPVVLKPARPPAPFKVLYAHTEEQLRRYIAEYGAQPLYQECAVGRVHNLCCFAAGGNVLAIHEYHSVRRLRGEGVLRRIVEPIPEAERSARAMLEALKWDGVAHVGFFVSGARLWYMETNGRFWGSLAGSVNAGWDFPFWTYEYFRHGKRPAPDPIKIGSRTCWHRGDLEALIVYLRGGEVPATGTRPGRLAAVFQYLGGFSPTIHSDVFRWNDPMPAVMEHWQRLRTAWRKLR